LHISKERSECLIARGKSRAWSAGFPSGALLKEYNQFVHFGRPPGTIRHGQIVADGAVKIGVAVRARVSKNLDRARIANVLQVRAADARTL
jgi:hypothetical protein